MHHGGTKMFQNGLVYTNKDFTMTTLLMPKRTTFKRGKYAFEEASV